MALKTGGLLDHLILVITNDDDNISQLANELQLLFGIKIIRTLHSGNDNEPMYRNLTKMSFRAKKLSVCAGKLGSTNKLGSADKLGSVGKPGKLDSTD
ncbi:hypothetical protein Bca4012_024756 [Brassica carinata]